MLKIFHLNIQSLNSKYLKLIEFITICSFQFDVIVLSEIWSSNIGYLQNILAGYSFFYKTPISSKAGGVGIFVRHELQPKLKSNISDIENHNTFFEHIWVEITLKSKKYCIAGFYRHPNTPVIAFTDALSKILHKMAKNKTIFVLGDINIDVCKYDRDPNTKLYVDLMCSYNLMPYSFLPTRITNTSATIIDHIFSNCQLLSPVSVKSGLVTCDIADHLGNFILISTDLQDDLMSRPLIRIFSSKNIAAFSNEIASIDWSSIYSSSSCVNYAFELFTAQYSSIFTKHFPLVRQSRKNFKHKTWITKALQNSIHYKNSLYKQWLTSKSLQDELLYKSYKKELKLLLAASRSAHYKKLLDGSINSSKGVWKCLNSLSLKNRKSSNGDLLNKVVHNNVCHLDSISIANTFNDYFIGISQELQKSLPAASISFKNFLGAPTMNSFFCTSTTPSEIINMINNIKNSGSAGPDNVPSSIIKHSKYAIADIFAYLCNLSFETGIFPDCLKIAKVIPLFKNGDKKFVTNYRPISLLNVFGKILEKLMCTRLDSYLTKYKLLYDFQFGFRRGHSCTLALIDVINTIQRELGNKNHVMGLFMDLSKAFDMVNHDILLSKLSHYGLRGHSLNWFSSYLSNRSQFTIINNVISSTKSIVSGVPQGSVLGPVLFLIYINDLCMSVQEHKLSLFADDANVFLFHHDPCMLFKIANKACSSLSVWFAANKLCVNLTKTSYMLFRPVKKLEDYISCHDPPVLLNKIKIPRVKSCKYLGLFLDENLNWSNHIQYLTTKVTQVTGIMYKFRDLLTLSLKKNIYYSLVYSSVIYGLELYGQTCDVHLKPLNIAVNRALRVILNVPLETPLKILYLNVDTLSLSLLHQFVVCKIVFRCLYMKNTTPLVIQDIFNCNVSIHQYSTRASSRSLLYRYANDGYLNSYSYYACTIWNHLPTVIRSISSLSTFIRMTKLHFANCLS